MAERSCGVVVTNVQNMNQLADCVQRGNYDTVKIITGWGVDEGGWCDDNKRRLFAMVPHVIVRTVSGDPSTGAPGENDFLDPHRVEQEIAPWYHLKPTIIIEIGNEPNVRNTDDDFFWKYRYFLAQTVERCRAVFPQARLIAPAPILGSQFHPDRFCEINADVMRQCDFIGMHVYEFYGFVASQQKASTKHLREAIDIYSRLFGDKAWYITEYGINDSKEVSVADKGARYAQMIHNGTSHPPLPDNVKGAVYYHICVRGDLHPEYHLYPAGDETYRQVGRRAAAFGVSFAIDQATAPAEQTATPDVSNSGAMPDTLPQHIHTLLVQVTTIEQQLLAQRITTTLNEDTSYLTAQLLHMQTLRATLESAYQCAINESDMARDMLNVAMQTLSAWELANHACDVARPESNEDNIPF